MTKEEIKTRIAESASDYMRGRAMALSFKPLTLQDVKEAFICGAEEMQSFGYKQAEKDLKITQENATTIILDICEEAYQHGYKQAEKDLETNRIETTINLDNILEKIYNTVTHFMDCKVSFPSEDEKKWDYYFLKKEIYGLYGKDKDITPPDKE